VIPNGKPKQTSEWHNGYEGAKIIYAAFVRSCPNKIQKLTADFLSSRKHVASGLLKTSTQSDAQEAKQMRSAAYMACASASSASFNAFKPLGSPVPITACYYQRIIDL
jgi:hypothetical protein